VTSVVRKILPSFCLMFSQKVKNKVMARNFAPFDKRRDTAPQRLRIVRSFRDGCQAGQNCLGHSIPRHDFFTPFCDPPSG
jgi:hypothetical protein